MLRAKAVLAIMGRTVPTRYLPLCSVVTFSALTCLSGCGSSGSPTSSGPFISSVSISPSTINLQVQQQQQFTDNVSGTGSYSSAVQWFVNGVAGGDGTVGTIVAGLYTAPGQPPSTSIT